MKKSTVAMITAGGLIVIGIVLAAIGFLSENKTEWKTGREEKNRVEVEISEDFDELRIEESSCDIMIMASDDGICRVESWETTGRELTAEVINGSLCVERNDQWEWHMLFSGDGMTRCKTVVYLPKDTCKRAKLTTTSGDICIAEGVKFGTLSLHSTSGEIEIDGISAEETSISVTSGGIWFCDSVTDSVTAHSTSGNIKFSEVSCENMKIDTTSGEIVMNNISAEVSAEMKATSGDIEFDRLKCEKIYLKATSGDIEGSIIGPMLCYYPESSSGDVRVPEITYGDNGSCRVETTSGDIRITEINE